MVEAVAQPSRIGIASLYCVLLSVAGRGLGNLYFFQLCIEIAYAVPWFYSPECLSPAVAESCSLT